MQCGLVLALAVFTALSGCGPKPAVAPSAEPSTETRPAAAASTTPAVSTPPNDAGARKLRSKKNREKLEKRPAMGKDLGKSLARFKKDGGPERASPNDRDPGELGGLTKADIDKVIKRGSAGARACFQKELNRTPGLQGKVVVSFRISGKGVVSRVRVRTASTTLHNKRVHDCLVRQVRKMVFPAKGGAFVNYPFVFSQG